MQKRGNGGCRGADSANGSLPWSMRNPQHPQRVYNNSTVSTKTTQRGVDVEGAGERYSTVRSDAVRALAKACVTSVGHYLLILHTPPSVYRH